MITLPQFNKVFQVDCDAKGSVISVVLSQEEMPTTYFNKKLDDPWRNYVGLMMNLRFVEGI
jgi:hypothetical protein